MVKKSGVAIGPPGKPVYGSWASVTKPSCVAGVASVSVTFGTGALPPEPEEEDPPPEEPEDEPPPEELLLEVVTATSVLHCTWPSVPIKVAVYVVFTVGETATLPAGTGVVVPTP